MIHRQPTRTVLGKQSHHIAAANAVARQGRSHRGNALIQLLKAEQLRRGPMGHVQSRRWTVGASQAGPKAINPLKIGPIGLSRQSTLVPAIALPAHPGLSHLNRSH